jgi:transposase-like protein
MPAYGWNEQRIQAAALVAAGRLTDLEIAAEVGVSDRQLRRWKRIPEFRARVEANLAAYRAFLGEEDEKDWLKREEAWRKQEEDPYKETKAFLARRGNSWVNRWE